MSDPAWKKAERKVARLFGAERNALSGGNSKVSRSDSIHERLFIEAKYRQRHAVWSLYQETRNRAVAEEKTPVVALIQKNHPGALLCIHTDDLLDVIQEYCLANACSVVYDPATGSVTVEQFQSEEDV